MISKLVKGRFGTWWHLIQTELPSGNSKVIATLCNYRSVEKLRASLQTNRESKQPFVYSIDPTPIQEPYRRCDECTCRIKG